MKYAIVKIGGSQYKLQEGDELDVPLLAVDPGEKTEFDQILLFRDGDNIVVGQPVVADMTVKATAVSNLRGEKIRVAIYRAKARYRKTRGHRDYLTRVKIEAIVPVKKAARKDSPKDNGTHKSRRKNQTA